MIRFLVVAAVLAGPAASANPPVVVPTLPERGSTGTDAVERGRTAYLAASRHYNRGRLKKALASARVAWAAVPNASTALIVATVLGQLKSHCEAMKFLLLASDLKPQPAEQQRIAKGLAASAAACGSGMGWARVAATPASAAITVASVAVKSGRTIGLAAGEHRIEVTQAGYVAQEDSVVATTGVGVRLKYTLSEKAVAAPRAPVEPVVTPRPAIEPAPQLTRPHSRPVRWPAWVALGTGVAVTGVGAVLYGLARGEASTAADLAAPQDGLAEPDRETRYNAAACSAEDLQTAGFVAGGIGIAALITGIVLVSLPADAPDVTVSPTRTGMAIHGRF